MYHFLQESTAQTLNHKKTNFNGDNFYDDIFLPFLTNSIGITMKDDDDIFDTYSMYHIKKKKNEKEEEIRDRDEFITAIEDCKQEYINFRIKSV